MKSIHTVLSLGAMVLLCTFANAQQPSQLRVTVSIEAQPLRAALSQFASQTGLQLMRRDEDVPMDGLIAPRVVGELSASEALDRLLANTGLKYEFVNDRTVRIAPVPPAEDTKASGAEADPIRLAQVDQTQAEKQVARSSKDESAETQITVTGTHIRGVASASPTTVIDRDYIEKSGLATVQDLIRSLPQSFGGGPSEYTIGITRNSANLNAAASTTVNLRGLGIGSTLVLIDGHRVAPAAYASFVDLSIVPLSAVERIEVLTDGASAIYGADAVGGVVNILLKKNFDGAETSLRYAQVAHSAASDVQASQSLGKDWGSGSALLAYEYFGKDPLRASERQYINQPANFDLFPEQKRHSGLLSVQQRFGERFDLSLDALYTDRSADRLGGRTRATDYSLGDVEASAASAILGTAIGDSWRGEIHAAYSENHTTGETLTATTRSVLDFVSNLSSFGAQADGTLFEMPGGRARLAAGIDYRTEDYDQRTVTTSTIAPYIPDRDVTAGYAELMLPLVGASNARMGLQRLELSAALRHERYSDFGSTDNPKFGVLWAPTAEVLARASFGRSFRAPTFRDVNDSNLAYFGEVLPDPRATVGTTTSTIYIVGNNAGLQPETAETFTAGLDFTPAWLKNFKASLNYFAIEYTDRIGTPNNPLAVLIDESIYAALVTRAPDPATINRYLNDPRFAVSNPAFNRNAVQAIVDGRLNNIGVTETSGLDLALNYSHGLAAGQMGWTFNGTYLLSFEQKITATSPAARLLDTAFNPNRLRMRAGADWSRGGFNVAAYVNYMGDYKNTLIAAAPPRVEANKTVDLSASYTFAQSSNALTNDLRLALSAQNLFDTKPPFLNDTSLWGGGRGFFFDPENGNPLGRVLALSIKKTW